MSGSVSHLTAQPVLVVGRFNRQRCAWCGVTIVDEDLSTLKSTDPDFKGTEWPTQRIVRISEGNPSISTLVADTGGKMPEDSCMSKFVDEVEEGEGMSVKAPPNLRLVDGH